MIPIAWFPQLCRGPDRSDWQDRKRQLVVVHVRRRFPEVRNLRRRLAHTQEQFAAGIGVNIWTLRYSESHRRERDGLMQTLREAIDRRPGARQSLEAALDRGGIPLSA